MRRVTGPFSLSINDESGLLVDGFDTPPSIMMGHARPYYASLLTCAGYEKAKDLLCYRFMLDQSLPPQMAAYLRKTQRMDGLVIRPLVMERYGNELETIIDIFNDAWSGNWGFVPLSDAEIRHMAKMLRPLVGPDHFAIAELDGAAVAMAVSLPNLNEAIADLNGRLFPLGWAKLLWRVKARTPKTARMPLMGVRKSHQGGPVGAALALSVIDAVWSARKKAGVEMAELSWILEDNWPMRRMIEQLGVEPYKTYRIFQRDLL